MVNTRFQVLFHSPHRGAFHLSLTVLLHYRSNWIFSLGTWTPLLPTGLACPVVLRILTRVHALSSTGLSPPLVLLSRQVRLTCGLVTRLVVRHPPCESYNPHVTTPTGYYVTWVWASPRSLATTRGILSSPAGTEMFQFPACPRSHLCVQCAVTVVHTAGLPHSEIQGL